jgi:hypothetical protein
MTLDELQNAWKQDCEIDVNDLTVAAAKSPNLHAKYLGELLQYKLRLTKLNNDMIEYRVKRARYYRGEMTKAELDENGWSQWQYKTLKSEIDNLIESEKDYQLMVTRDAYIKAVVYFVESVMTELRSR